MTEAPPTCAPVTPWLPQVIDATVLDVTVLDGVAADTEDAGFAHSFARRFQQLLPRRRDRVATAIARHDAEAAMDALLSLRVASTMVGARELQALAGELETSVRAADFAAARLCSRALPAAVERARLALDQHLGTASAAL